MFAVVLGVLGDSRVAPAVNRDVERDAWLERWDEASHDWQVVTCLIVGDVHVGDDVAVDSELLQWYGR